MLAVIFLTMRTYFDYADGLFARKYAMVTCMGDIYDHVGDWVFISGILYLFAFSKYPENVKKTFLYILLVVGILSVIQTGCIEHEYHDESMAETTISRLRHVCPVPMKQFIKLFDGGSIFIVIIILASVFCSYK